MTTKVEKTVVVDVPLSTVYNQWTQFEEFPEFMGGVEKITQLSDDRLEWWPRWAEFAGSGSPRSEARPRQARCTGTSRSVRRCSIGNLSPPRPSHRRLDCGTSRWQHCSALRPAGAQERVGTAPCICLGEAKYVSHTGDRPVDTTWKLTNPNAD